LQIFPIHPQSAGQFRQALYPSRRKSDPADSEMLLELLIHHQDHLHALQRKTRLRGA
jgi:hypothetical protein